MVAIPSDISQIDVEIAEDGTLLLYGHTADLDRTYTAVVGKIVWQLHASKGSRPAPSRRRADPPPALGTGVPTATKETA